MDYGCGSGILAIAALKLGAKQAVGIDNDPQAIIASKNNSDKNKISRDQFKVYLPHEQQNDLTADVLVANILAKPLMTLAPNICNSIKINGKFALSGILREQADEVANVYSAYCNIDKIIHRDDWVLISGTKKSKN
ncbi:MAG: ribosomal protein L11 methyltransferase [Francisellaceae bacterium]